MTTTPERVPAHTPRLEMAAHAPELYRAMARFDTAARAGMDPVLMELVRIRASQINGCAYCIDMHTKSALAAGESVERIVALSAWEEAQHYYSPREVAAIELTEAATRLADGGVPEAVWARAAARFSEEELAHLVGAIAAINAWNRFAVTTRMVAGAQGH